MIRYQHTVSLYIHEGAQWGQSSATNQKMLDAANSMSPLYDVDKFNLFSNGFARKLSNVEFSALMVRHARGYNCVGKRRVRFSQCGRFNRSLHLAIPYRS